MKTATAPAWFAAPGPAASGQMLQGAEQGALALVIEGFTRVDQTITLRQGETAWTNDHGADTCYVSSFLKGRALIPKTGCEAALRADLQPAEVRMVFADINGAPRFGMSVKPDQIDDRLDCKVAPPSGCEVLGVRLAFNSALDLKAAITVSCEAAAAHRSFGVRDPIKHLQ